MPDTRSNKSHGLLYRIAVPSPLRQLFDYLPPPEQATIPLPGVRVRIPFGRRQLVGILVECTRTTSIDRSRLRSALAVLDAQPLFSDAILKLLRWSIDYYQHPPGDVFATALPVKVRQGASLRAEVERWQVCASPVTAESVLARSPRQQALFTLLSDHGGQTRKQIQSHGFSPQLLKQLREKELVKAEQEQLREPQPFTLGNRNDSDKHPLNPQQIDAVDTIADALHGFRCFLLDGITGSGKTEVYLQIMQRVLEAGKQCLVLVPEIGLTPQTIARFRQRFDCPVATLHSGLNDSERFQAWNAARTGQAGIIIGTRSAIFTPMHNPGLVIIDEEHDNSLKQQEGFRYSARDLAVMRGKEEGIPVILGSATPSLESLHNAGSGKFTPLYLDTRTGQSKPATMRVIDIAAQSLISGFSELVLHKIGEHLQAGNQVLAFINRRGFAPVLRCLTCAWVAECDDCIAQLTLHSKPPGLRCHHCGKLAPVPVACPQCASRELATLGQGTQQIEARLLRQFPGFPVLRIDRDSTRSRSRLEAMLELVHSGQPCLLLGTQMLAKGHHFPNITLVAILDADSGLFSADFRGQEQMAQTIVQVAGRAGRADRKGEVLIQSRHATHAVLQQLVNLPYREFAAQLLEERKAARMPPFTHLALLRAESPAADASMQFLIQVEQCLQQLDQNKRSGTDWLGPVPAPMEKRAGRFRSHLLLRSHSRAALQSLLQRLVPLTAELHSPTRLRWSLDVDPQEMI